jgi:hypothetical protein
MNTDYINTLLASLQQAKDALSQWSDYKAKVEDALKQALELPDPETLVQGLRTKHTGSTTLKPYEGLEAKFSVELSFDQNKILSVLQEHPELYGLVVQTKYEPTSAKALFTYLESGNPAASAVESALKVAKRGPYLSLVATKESA